MYNNAPYESPGEEDFFQQRKKNLIKQKELAESIILLARKKGEMILKNAQKGAVKISEQAYNKGYKEGIEKGTEQGRIKGYEEFNKETREVIENIKQKEIEFQENLINLLDRLEYKIMDLTMNIVRKMLNKEMELDQDHIIHTIREASRELTQRDLIQISVNRKEVEKVTAEKQELISSSELIKDIEVLPCDDIESGGCILSSQSGIVDARIDSKMEVVKEIVSN